jgi:hypothetical protein
MLGCLMEAALEVILEPIATALFEGVAYLFCRAWNEFRSLF